MSATTEELERYNRGTPPAFPESQPQYLQDELTKIERSMGATQEYAESTQAAGNALDAKFTEKVNVLAQADEALAEKITSLEASVSNDIQETNASLSEEMRTRATQDEALSEKIEKLSAKVKKGQEVTEAMVQEETRARASSTAAVAEKVTTLKTTVAGHTASIKETIESVDGVKAKWGVTINNNGAVSGVELLSGADAHSEFTVTADAFKVYTSAGNVNPFGVDGSGAYVNGTLRVNATGGTLTTLGTTGVLTNEAAVVAADSSGNVSSFTGAGGTFRVYQGNVEYTGTAVTYSVVSSTGVTISINTTGVYSVTSMSADTGTATLRAVYNGVTLDKVYSISKSKAGANGTNGTNGINGTNGTNGTNGQRGNVQIIATGYSSWSDSAATSAISAAGYGSPVNRDMVTLTNGSSFSEQRYYSSGSWLTLAAYFNGNMIVNGTLSVNALTAGTASDSRGSVEMLGFSTVLKVSRTSSTTLPAVFISDTSGAGTQSLYVSSNSTHTYSVSFDCGSTTTLGVTSSNSGYSAGKFINSGSSKQVWLAPGAYSAYSPTGGGKFYAVDGNGPFTGFHDGLIQKGSYVIGDILVDKQVVHKPDINNTLTEVEVSSSANQKGVIGVLSAIREFDEFLNIPYEMWWSWSHTHDIADMNAVGEGQINVCGENGDIQVGDLIVTSSTPGKGMRQSDDIIRSYTVAKAREAVTFSSPSEIKQIACIYLCG